MRTQRLIVLIVLLSFLSGCYFGITGRVIDAETKHPLEGAVVLVEWTKTKGFGLTYTESYKVAEVLSDKDGKFDLPGCYSPFVNAPDITVYKKGYVAWNNKHIFPGYDKRMDFDWSNKYIFKMEKFDKKYSHDKHVDFIGMTIGASQKLELKKMIFDAFAWERQLSFEERQKTAK